MTGPHMIEAGVLGKLLLMQSVIASLPEALILPFVVEGLSDLELGGPVTHLPAGAMAPHVLFHHSLYSSASDYGQLLFDPPDAERFQLYFDHIRNFLFTVLVMLDERRQRATIENYQRTLEAQVAERTRELVHRNEQLLAAQAATVTAFSALTEARHHETGHHIQRTKLYVRLLAEALRGHPRFATLLDGKTIQLYADSAPLHDIGKVAIPDRILLKPGKLHPREWEIMQQHCVIGRDTIIASARELGEGDDGFLACAAEIAFCHHERWDGLGYPSALAGDNIPLSARLMAVADVYDALASARVYKPAFPREQVIRQMSGEAGRHFDPDIAACLLANESRFWTITQEWAD